MPASISEVMHQHNLVPDKRLGQHFLTDSDITDRIVLAAGTLAGAKVLEVGPGPGCLTRSILARHPARLIVVEKDPVCCTIIQELQAASAIDIDIYQADALEFDEQKALGEAAIAKLIANLPYNIATPLLLKWAKHKELFDVIVVMVQKEVAERLYAKPATKHYGRLSVIMQFLYEIEEVFDIEPYHFTPPPKVMSTVVRLRPRMELPIFCDLDKLTEVVKAAFMARRKVLRRTIFNLHVDMPSILADLGIDSGKRGEELTVQEFASIALRL